MGSILFGLGGWRFQRRTPQYRNQTFFLSQEEKSENHVICHGQYDFSINVDNY
jgi:hypothetical protein